MKDTNKSGDKATYAPSRLNPLRRWKAKNPPTQPPALATFCKSSYHNAKRAVVERVRTTPENTCAIGAGNGNNRSRTAVPYNKAPGKR
jgi:hypothetical protein